MDRWRWKPETKGVKGHEFVHVDGSQFFPVDENTQGAFSSAGIGICIVFDVTTNTVAILFVFVNYCPNID